MSSIVETVRARLAELGAEHSIVACDPEFADTAAFCERYGYELADSANTIIVVGKVTPRVYAACVVLADTRLDVNGAMRRRLGARKASFASADETRELTGMEIGGVTPIALPADLPLWIDARVLERPQVVIGGGDRASKLVLAPQALASLANAEVVEDLSKET